MSLKLYISNDNVLTLVGLRNSVSAAYINAATVTVTLVDSEGTDIAGETWPVSMSYVASSDGNYQATLADTLTGLTDADVVTAKVDADGGAGLKGHWEVPLVATTRDT